MEDPFELAADLREINGVDDVRACKRRITVVVAPNEPHIEQIPENVHKHIHDRIEGTPWQTLHDEKGDVERHAWGGGVHHDPILSATDQPRCYELQYHLV